MKNHSVELSDIKCGDILVIDSIYIFSSTVNFKRTNIVFIASGEENKMLDLNLFKVISIPAFAYIGLDGNLFIRNQSDKFPCSVSYIIGPPKYSNIIRKPKFEEALELLKLMTTSRFSYNRKTKEILSK